MGSSLLKLVVVDTEGVGVMAPLAWSWVEAVRTMSMLLRIGRLRAAEGSGPEVSISNTDAFFRVLRRPIGSSSGVGGVGDPGGEGSAPWGAELLQDSIT